MPDYAEILEFLAKNPPQLAAERQLHASMLELMAQCLRNDGQPQDTERQAAPSDLAEEIAAHHRKWVHFS
ncbi:MAG: hypothetical protein MI824_03240 [Hyphomicrobiales bacterium]|nr:hypothetical protein [Hyphomicrobiales bacterium]